MAGEAKSGAHWEGDELDVIVADYFDMLAADLSKRPYVKSRHSASIMARIARSHRSVEFKHQNISAVLEELGMPWIPGYNKTRYCVDPASQWLLQEVSSLLLFPPIEPGRLLWVREPDAAGSVPNLNGGDYVSRHNIAHIGSLRNALINGASKRRPPYFRSEIDRVFQRRRNGKNTCFLGE